MPYTPRKNCNTKRNVTERGFSVMHWALDYIRKYVDKNASLEFEQGGDVRHIIYRLETGEHKAVGHHNAGRLVLWAEQRYFTKAQAVALAKDMGVL